MDKTSKTDAGEIAIDRPCAAGVTSVVACGTHRGYRNGCRCVGRVYAMRVHNQRYRRKNRVKVLPSEEASRSALREALAKVRP